MRPGRLPAARAPPVAAVRGGRHGPAIRSGGDGRRRCAVPDAALVAGARTAAARTGLLHVGQVLRPGRSRRRRPCAGRRTDRLDRAALRHRRSGGSPLAGRSLEGPRHARRALPAAARARRDRTCCGRRRRVGRRLRRSGRPVRGSRRRRQRSAQCAAGALQPGQLAAAAWALRGGAEAVQAGRVGVRALVSAGAAARAARHPAGASTARPCRPRPGGAAPGHRPGRNRAARAAAARARQGGAGAAVPAAARRTRQPGHAGRGRHRRMAARGAGPARSRRSGRRARRPR